MRAKGIAMFKKTQVADPGAWSRTCRCSPAPDCGSSHAIFGHGGARETAEKSWGRRSLGEIPLVPLHPAKTSDVRPRPVQRLGRPDGPEAKAFSGFWPPKGPRRHWKPKSKGPAPKIVLSKLIF